MAGIDPRHEIPGMNKMPPKFELGKITIKEDAAFALARAGQDADFFLAKHATGDWGEGSPDQNEQALREGHMLLSVYRTLWGQPLLIATFQGKKETVLFCPPAPVVIHCNPLVDFALYWESLANRRKAQDSDADAS
jgi:hypothetical protein